MVQATLASAAPLSMMFWGTPGCLGADTPIKYESRGPDGRCRSAKGGTIERLFQVFHQLPGAGKGRYQIAPADSVFYVTSMDDAGRLFKNRVIDVIRSGRKSTHYMRTSGGFEIEATADHLFFTGERYTCLADLRVGGAVYVHANVLLRDAPDDAAPGVRHTFYVKAHPHAPMKVVGGRYKYHALRRARAVVEAHLNQMDVATYIARLNDANLDGLQFLAPDMDVHHDDEDVSNDALSNLRVLSHAEHARHHAEERPLHYVATPDTIEEIVEVGEQDTYDIVVADPYRNFVAGGFVVHNCGKTSLVGQVASEMGVGFKSVVAHLYQPVDVTGLPYIVDGKCDYAPPTVFPDAERDGPRGLFFLDELPNCVPAMQSAWGVVVLERSTRHYRFPPGWIIVCAGNRETDRAGSSRLVSALENRMIHVDVAPSSEEFLAYAVSRGLHPTVSAFVETRPDMLSLFDPKSADRGFPSPRSWERVSDVMKLGLGDGPQAEMLKGAIGNGAACEFAAYAKTFGELPKLADVLSGAADLSKITRPDVMRAVVYSVLAWAGEEPTDARYAPASGVALRIPDEWAVLLVRRMYELSPTRMMAAPTWASLSSKFIKYVR